MWQEISKFGKKLVNYGLAGAHFGNISVRTGNKILITRSGSMLDELNQDAIVEVTLGRMSSLAADASVEMPVHRAIYEKTSALAVIHAHSPFAIVQSMLSKGNLLIPEDCESKYFLQGVPIVTGEPGSDRLAENAAKALKKHKGVIVKGHGTFAIGKNLEEAYAVVSSIEQVCKIKYYTDLYGYFRKNCRSEKTNFKRTKRQVINHKN